MQTCDYVPLKGYGYDEERSEGENIAAALFCIANELMHLGSGTVERRGALEGFSMHLAETIERAVDRLIEGLQE